MPSWAKLIHVKKSPVASTRRYHHIGIPTTERREGERLIEHYATFVSGYETSAYGIEWTRFGPEAPSLNSCVLFRMSASKWTISPLKSPEKRYLLRPTHPHRA